ncbi:uncharacterized protein LOC115405521 [Salarias fasciatus]|uniref:uncharacterized protein LOC115405521 n=1 Tax=Salarias fasciatus TaxID=181472 RepID=UPI0011764F97|nr:uncharacterized protein LOC115405521 [Salarias fasciatus]
MGKSESLQTEVETSSYVLNVTGYCPPLQAVSSSLSVDNQDLSLDLSQSCSVPRLSGTLRHSFARLRSRGLPEMVSVQASAPPGPEQPGGLRVTSKSGNHRFEGEAVVQMEECAVSTAGAVLTQPGLQGSLLYHNNCSVFQIERGSADGETFTLQSQFGAQQAGLRLKVKILPMTKDMRGTVWHSWTWLRDRGLPLHVEGLCSIQGVFPQLRSRAQLSVDRHKLLASGFNLSSADGHLAALLSYSPSAFNQTSSRHSLDTALAVQFKGPLQSASLAAHGRDWRVRVVGDVGGLGSQGGTKEARLTVKHTIQGQANPALQVEAWGRLTESQLRCSMAVNPELSHSLALIVQGHYVPHSKDLMVKVAQNVPGMLVYLPPQLSVRSQLNQSESSVAALVEASSGRKRLWALGELAATGSGFRHAVDVKHSYPQLKPLPRTVTVRTEYEARRWSYQVRHAAVWGNQEFSLSGRYSAPPALELDNHTVSVQIVCVPRLTSLEVTLQRSLRGGLDRVLLGWMRHGQLQQVGALRSWSCSEAVNQTTLELEQPFSAALSRLSLNTVSRSSPREQSSSQQTHLSWGSGVPVNVSLSLNKQWQKSSSRGQACALLSAQQIAGSPVKGCVSVRQEGNSYLQNAELRWDNRSVKQSMNYQRGVQGTHTVQVNISLDRVSTAPCHSHTLQAKVHTNLRDRVEHAVLLGLCPSQPSLSWSGAHRMNSGDELFHTRSLLSVAGRPAHCSFALALTNSSGAQGSNVSLFSESRVGNWSVDVRGDALSWPQGLGVQIRASLDHRDHIWLSGTVQGPCLQTTAGYVNGTEVGEDLTVKTCLEPDRSLMLEVRRSGGSGKPEPLGIVLLGAVDQKLLLKASGCLGALTAAEERVHYLTAHIRNKLLQRIKTFERLLVEFRQQARGSRLLQGLTALPLQASQRAEAALGRGDGGVLDLWRASAPRRLLTAALPRLLAQLHQASLLGQQELRRPLATLAGVYQDVTGQRLEAVWRQEVLQWAEGLLVEILPALLQNPQLRPPCQAAAAAAGLALDLAGQHTYHWTEGRLAAALSGVRKRLASVYKLSPSECSLTVSVPLPSPPRPGAAGSGFIGILLEEWILRPLQTLVSLSPGAELYRLKRKIMDGPFAHRALLVADQFVVTFDGHLYELPASCPLLLARDAAGADPSFTLLLGTDPRTFLLVQMKNASVHVTRSGQVKADCDAAAAHTLHSDSRVTVRKHSNTLHVWSHDGVSVSCDLSAEVCSFTLDGWLHGSSAGLLGTNDNEAGNDFPLRDGSQAENMEQFFQSWQMKPTCPGSKASPASSPVTCHFLFSSSDSPLSSCFRVVDPIRFLSVCESSSSRAPCRLASAFVHLCHWNYVPLEIPVQCLKV